MDRREIGWNSVDWIHLAQDGEQWWAPEHNSEPSDSMKGGEFLD
jgi:hypothetical protein